MDGGDNGNNGTDVDGGNGTDINRGNGDNNGTDVNEGNGGNNGTDIIGGNGDNNGTDVDSNADKLCRGRFSTGCDAQGQSCDYRATWEVREARVDFSVTARQVQDGRTEWVALGFSDNRMMVSGYLRTHSRCLHKCL